MMRAVASFGKVQAFSGQCRPAYGMTAMRAAAPMAGFSAYQFDTVSGQFECRIQEEKPRF
jgi:hypothetical protein